MKKLISILILISNFAFSQEVEVEVDSLEFYKSNYQYLKAINYIDKLEVENLAPESYRRIKAKLYADIGSYAQSENLYREIFLKSNNDIALGIDYGGILYKQAKFSQALEVYKQLYKSDTSNVYLLNLMAQTFQKEDKDYDAMRAYKKISEIDSTNINALYNVSRLLMKNEHYGGAVIWADKGLEIDSLHPGLLFQKAKGYFKMKYRSADLILEKLLTVSDTTKSIRILYGQVCYNSKEYEKAIFWLKDLTNPQDETEEIHFLIANSYTKLSKPLLARKHFIKSVELGISPFIYVYFESLAYNYLETDSYRDAIKTWEQIYALSDNPKYLFYSANIYYTYLKDLSSAMERYKRIIDNSKYSESEFYLKASQRFQEVKKELFLKGELE